MQFAAKWLPDIDELADDANWGRVSRSAALGMIMRIGLYEGTYIKYHNLSEGDSRSHLLKAINAADTIINIEKKHELYPDFQTLFYFEGEGRQNKENVFVKVYGPDKTGIVHNNSRGLEMQLLLVGRCWIISCMQMAFHGKYLLCVLFRK